jgi:hypothetical protein
MTKEYWANLILCGFLLILAVFAMTRIGSVLKPKGLFVGEPEPAKEAASLLKKIRLTQFSFTQGEDHKVTADFYIRNNSTEDVKNLHVTCDLYDQNGVYMDREKWILFHTFPGAKEEKYTSVSQRLMNLKGPVECQIIDLEPVQEPFFKLHRSAGGGHGASHSEGGGHHESHGSGH